MFRQRMHHLAGRLPTVAAYCVVCLNCRHLVTQELVLSIVDSRDAPASAKPVQSPRASLVCETYHVSSGFLLLVLIRFRLGGIFHRKILGAKAAQAYGVQHAVRASQVEA